MRIHIFLNDKVPNNMLDTEVLTYLFKRCKEKPKLNHYHINNLNIKEKATINVFVDSFNLYHISNAKYNIFIPNHHYFLKNWIDSLGYFDLILCKTNYCYQLYEEIVEDKTKLKYIGWRSPNNNLNVDKDFEDWLLLYNDPYFNDIQKILDIWDINYPTLNIVFNGVTNPKLKRKNLSNINYIEQITPEKYELLFNKCIVHLCLDRMDNYNHAINQCCLAKSVPILLNKVPSNDIVDTDGSFKLSSKRKRFMGGLGSIYNYNQEDLVELIEKVINTSESTLEIMGKNAYDQTYKKQQIFNNDMHNILNDVFKKTIKIKFNQKKYDELPKLSIITPINNLDDIFKVSILNYRSTTFNKSNLEWIIIDDSDDNKKVHHILPSKENMSKFNIKYIDLEERTCLENKLNMGIDMASNEVILIMMPDDFLYEKGINSTVTKLLQSDKQCVGYTQYGCFDINRYISIVNVTDFTLKYSHRIYPGSLCFYKTFWEKQKFKNIENVNCLDHFFENRITDFCEINSKEILVGLVHTRNANVRYIEPKVEPNGNHFNFTEKLFKFLCSLDEQKKKEIEDREKELEEIRKKAEEEEDNELQENEEKIEIVNSKEIKEI